MNLRELAKAIRITNAEKGWVAKVPEDNPSMFSEKLALMHSELSEALEEFRDGRGVNEIYFQQRGLVLHHSKEVFNHNPPENKPEGVPIELADCIIRILDFCEANDIDIEEAINLKMKYNETRPYRHGGKKA